MCMGPNQVPAAAHHLLRGPVSQEEAVLPQLRHHRLLWHLRHLRRLCAHRARAVRHRAAAQCARPIGAPPSLHPLSHPVAICCLAQPAMYPILDLQITTIHNTTKAMLWPVARFLSKKCFSAMDCAGCSTPCLMSAHANVCHASTCMKGLSLLLLCVQDSLALGVIFAATDSVAVLQVHTGSCSAECHAGLSHLHACIHQSAHPLHDAQ